MHKLCTKERDNIFLWTNEALSEWKIKERKAGSIQKDSGMEGQKSM